MAPSIGIFGGTFDPIHYGHLRSASEVGDALKLDQVRLLPSRIPPHRAQPQVSSDLRLRMIQLALTEFPSLAVDQRELQRSGPSYMVNTLESLRAEFGAQARLILLLGVDAFNDLESWFQWQRLFDLASLAVIGRPGVQLTKTGELAQKISALQGVEDAPQGALKLIDLQPWSISASQIRQKLVAGDSPKGLLPNAVLDYIYQQGLYGANN